MSGFCFPTEKQKANDVASIAPWRKQTWILDRIHDILPACFIASALFAPPSWLTLHPLVLMILFLDWSDSDGQCFLTKFSRVIAGEESEQTPWLYTKESVQHSNQWTNPLYLFFGGEPKDHNDSIIKANKSTFLSLSILTLATFVAWIRVTRHYKIPGLTNAKLRYILLAYFICWVASMIFL